MSRKGWKGSHNSQRRRNPWLYKKTALMLFKKSTEVVEMARVNELNSHLVTKVARYPKAAPDSNPTSWKLSILQDLLFVTVVVSRWRHRRSNCHPNQRISTAGNLKKRMRCKLEVSSILSFPCSTLINTDTITLYVPQKTTKYMNLTVSDVVLHSSCAFWVLGMYQNYVVSWWKKNKTPTSVFIKEKKHSEKNFCDSAWLFDIPQNYNSRGRFVPHIFFFCLISQGNT